MAQSQKNLYITASTKEWWAYLRVYVKTLFMSILNIIFYEKIITEDHLNNGFYVKIIRMI
jgi:hypothetical protein